MDSSPVVGLVVPCYNEEQRFPSSTFAAFLTERPNISLILANDGSRDGTVAVLRRLEQQFPGRVHVLDRAENRGKGETVREGMLKALDLRCGVVGFWDADLATPLEAVFDMLPVLEARPEVQMVFGARVQLLGRDIQRLPIRHYLGRVFATTVSVMLRLPIYDTQCGAKLFRASPQLAEILGQPFGSRWVFDVEIIARWIRLLRFEDARIRQSIYEFPLHRWVDVAGSKVKPHHFLVAFSDVVRIYMRYFLRER